MATPPLSAAAVQADRLLAAALRGEAPDWPPEADAGVAVERLALHGIAHHLATGALVPPDWPGPLLQAMADEARLQALWEADHQALLARLCTRMLAAGITPVWMKGTALAYSVYAEPASRRRGDSDLLVGAKQLATTRRLLAEAGLVRRADPHGLFFQESWLADTGCGFVHAIDLHWQVTDSPALQRALPLADFLSRTIALDRLAPGARAPHPVLTFLQGALNQAWHGAHGYVLEDQRPSGQGRLIWALDNHLLAESFSAADWDELVRLALARRIAIPVRSALLLAQSCLGTRLPGDVLTRLASGDPQTDLVWHLLETNPFRRFRRDFAALPSLAAKARFALGHALPAASHLRHKYPAAAHWPVPLLHLRRLGELARRWNKAERG